MSVSLDALVKKPAVCYTIFKEAYKGTLEAADAGFNVVFSECTLRNDSSDLGKSDMLTFLRGDTVVYLCFDATIGSL
ncbi:unnamed protein product [Phytomonas sp. Hart1]|nr:unnamed protein product [Phytomonas sp. Hart1]|eukprot:CCW71284.1 unnamed protein product [Phytomonas sp. isolate Hart1]